MRPVGEQELAERFASEIRAELVCCDIYRRIANTREAESVDETGHSICFWGEAAARIVLSTAGIEVEEPDGKSR